MRYLQGIISYVTLKYNMPVLSRHILKLSLTKKVGKPEPGLSFYLRKSEHLTVIDLIDNMRLQNDYEAYLKALVLRHEKNYKGSLEMIANDRNKALIPFKTKLYYNLKQFDDIVQVANSGYDVFGDLSVEQQEILLRNLLKRNEYQLIEKMIESTNKNKEGLEELYFQEKDDLFYQYSWSNYRENILEGVDRESTLEEIKEAVENTDDNLKDLGYVLVINNYYLAERHLTDLNELFVDHLNNKEELFKYIDPIALDTLNFELNYKDKKSERLQNLLNYHHFGKGTKMLMNNIFKLLPEVTLNAQHIMSIRRLILDGHLNFDDGQIKKLFKSDKRLESVFHSATLFLDEDTNSITDKFVHHNFNSKGKRRIYNAVINQLQRVNKRYELPFYLFSYLEKSVGKKQNYAYILARFYATEDDTEKLEQIIHSVSTEKRFKIHINLSMYLFNLKMYSKSLLHAEEAYKIKSNSADVLRALIRANHVMGNIDERYYKLIEMRKHFPSRVYPGEFLMAEQEYQLSHTDWEAEPLPEGLQYEDDGNTVLFVLNKAMPATNGYTIRTNEIVSRVQEHGYRPVATARLGWSPEHENYVKPGLDDGDYRTYFIDRSDRYLTNRTPLRKYFNVYKSELLKIVLDEKPAVIHAASNFQNAMPALQLGNQLGIKTIYEVRGMWHHTQTSKVPEFYNSDRFNMQEHYEVLCCEYADEIIVISESLREYLILKGISADKITVLPNGVDTEKLSPLTKSTDIIEQYQLKDSVVLGFIGSITNYEGIDLIIDTVQALNNKTNLDTKFKLLVVGDGQHRATLQRKVLDQNLSEDVIFTGKVPFDTVKDYYSVIDIAPFPRQDKLVCQLVTPIKTYEAMAMSKRVIVSDVNALKEMVIDQVNGVYFKADDSEALTEAVISVLNNESIGDSARDWVVENRDWDVLLKKLVKVYERLDIKAS